jgi:hypothetical protein
MRPKGRRRLDRVLIVLGGGVAAGASAIGGLVTSTEQIDSMWVSATLDEAGGPAAIHEVIDYDFGPLPTDKHGLRRLIPGLATSDAISVSSPTAPDGIAAHLSTFIDGEPGIELRVGDPNTVVTGDHRYSLAYALGTIGGTDLGWDAVGLAWEVPIERAEIHVVAPWGFEDVRCDRGREGDTGGCEVDQPEQGHLVVQASGFAAGEGLTIYAEAGVLLPRGAPAAPEPPSTATDPGAGFALPAAAAGVAAVGGGASMSMFVRRRGRDRVGAGGAADAAWAGASTSEVRLDSNELDEMATTDVAPPEGVSAPMGGVILAEAVRSEHKVAWLIEAAVHGAVDLVEEDGKTVRIVRTAPGDPETKQALDAMFAGRDEIELGAYDAVFAKGWGKVGEQLEEASKSSDLWDASADRLRGRIRVLGFIAALLAIVGVGIGGAMAASRGESRIGFLVAAALIAGAGFAATLRGWELRVRTPKGSGTYLRVESFRRFLAQSEAYHAEEAAKRGVLREYTAWAVAVGEIGRWSRAVESSTVIPAAAGIGYVHMAPMLMASTSSASTAPSSSGGGGGGGGGSGGGGGGGGGGSW